MDAHTVDAHTGDARTGDARGMRAMRATEDAHATGDAHGTPSRVPHGASASASRPPTAIMVVLLTGGFLSLFNETILNVALSDIMDELHVDASMVQWLSTGYVLVVAVMVPVSAFLVRTFTTRQLYVGAMGVFLLGTAAAVVAPTFPLLLASRMVQAGGTGLLAPIMIDTALSIYPRDRHGFIMGICTAVILVGPSVGPIVSGAILMVADWRALFALLLVPVVVCMVAGSLVLGSSIPVTRPRIDGLSIVLSTLGFSGLVYAMSVLTVVAGRLFDRIGARRLMTIGLIVVIVFLVVMATVGASTPVVAIMLVNMGVYVGIALIWSPNQSNALAQLSMGDQTDGVSLINTFIQLGSALGTPLFVGIMNSGRESFTVANAESGYRGSATFVARAWQSGFRNAMVVAAVLVSLAAVVTAIVDHAARRSEPSVAVV